MTLTQIIESVIAGGLLGSLGQGIRIAVGLKKLNEENAVNAMTDNVQEPLSPARLIISVFIGFVAGAIGMLVNGVTIGKNGDFDTEAIITVIAIGYAGADFIEGIFLTYAKRFSTSTAFRRSQEMQRERPAL